MVTSLFFSTFANGIVLTFETKDLSSKEKAQTGTMYISGKNVNMQIFGGDYKAYSIFSGDKEVLWAVDEEKKEYTAITKETMKQMGGVMDAAMQQMQAQMAQMPAEQRAMMEEMMKQQMGSMQSETKEETTYKNTGQKKKISGYPCVKYVGMRGKEKVQEMWVTQWGNFKNSKETLAAFQAMSDFFKSFLEAFKNSPFLSSLDNPYSYNEKLNGFPVVVTQYSEGKPALEIVFKGSEKKALPASLFKPPKGYKANTVNMPEQ